VSSELVQPQHRELSKKEREELVAKGFAIERTIVAATAGVNVATWTLAEALYEFHEGGFWGLLGYDTLNEFLARPDVGISRTQFFRLTRMWRDLVVVREIDVDDLKEIEPSKIDVVTPAISKGKVKVADALADARELGTRDLRTRYAEANPNRQKLDPEEEPLRKQCSNCGSWVDADQLPEEGDDEPR
jgi:hypothetical protein